MLWLNKSEHGIDRWRRFLLFASSCSSGHPLHNWLGCSPEIIIFKRLMLRRSDKDKPPAPSSGKSIKSLFITPLLLLVVFEYIWTLDLAWPWMDREDPVDMTGGWCSFPAVEWLITNRFPAPLHLISAQLSNSSSSSSSAPVPAPKGGRGRVVDEHGWACRYRIDWIYTNRE